MPTQVSSRRRAPATPESVPQKVAEPSEPPKPEPVSLDAIMLIGHPTQSRMRTDPEVVEQYAEAWRTGVKFPPVDLFLDADGLYHIGDGIHRCEGAVKAGRSSILAIVHQGDERDARMFACGANRNHGLHRSNADKRRAAEIMLELEPKWTNVRIAQHCGISDQLVADVRRSLEGAKVIAPAPVRESLDGKRQPAQQRRPAAQGRESRPSEKPPAAAPAISGGVSFDVPEIEAATVVVDIPTLIERYRRLNKTLAWCRREVEDLAADEKYGPNIACKSVRIAGDIESARVAVREAEPAGCCKVCKGSGCDKCQGTGFWNKATMRMKQEFQK